MNLYRYILWGLGVLVLGSGCSSESAIQQVLGVSAEAPVFLGCKAVSSQKIDFQFSLPVRVVSLYFDPPLEATEVTEGAQVEVTVTQDLPGGSAVTVYMLVEDHQRNTLNLLIPFRTRNERFPSLMITELRTEYAKGKAEFVEVKSLSSGNLGALRLFIASQGDTPVFEFPPVEVASGEYLVIHLRSLDAGLSNETGTDRGASTGPEALVEARDFWVPDTRKRLRKTDVVFFMDQDDQILDAVVLSEKAEPWAKVEVAEAARQVSDQGAWLPSPEPHHAVPSKGTTVTRSISRDEALADRNRAEDWYITATSGVSPGKANTLKRYTPK
ncbi:MAG: hypothetical protein LBD74_00020 [Spirochaetaceae bacterium]|jgi:hypothetical protein|nr:hypothetical protein [Spirochaetaceae bacterium]